MAYYRHAAQEAEKQRRLKETKALLMLGPITQADIQRRTGMTQQQTSRVLKELNAKHYDSAPRVGSGRRQWRYFLPHPSVRALTNTVEKSAMQDLLLAWK